MDDMAAQGFASFDGEEKNEEEQKGVVAENKNDFDHLLRELTNIESKKEVLNGHSRDLERLVSSISSILQKVHCEPGVLPNDDIMKAQELMSDATNIISKMRAVVDPANFYMYHNCFRFGLQHLYFASSFLNFIQNRRTLSREQLANHFSLKINAGEGFHLDIEDYLFSQLNLITEVVRFATNSVTYGNIVVPFEVAEFVRKMDTQFRVLNLKNDALRRRFDVLKYDVRRIEQIVYDLSIRGLKQKSCD